MSELEKLKEKAKWSGDEVFIAELTSEELRDSGFEPWETWTEEEFFGSFEYVDIYLLYDTETDSYKLKYLFDDSEGSFYYEYEKDLGESFWLIVEEYLEMQKDKEANE